MSGMLGHRMMSQGMMGHASRGPAQSASSGARDFDHVCAKCHALPSPKLHTAAQWPQVVERMRQHLAAAGTKLDRKAELKIEQYLKKKAKK
jgi:cytochrome c5